MSSLFMNVFVKILKTSNITQYLNKTKIYHVQIGFILEIQEWFIIRRIYQFNSDSLMENRRKLRIQRNFTNIPKRTIDWEYDSVV
jgi:hypothetical protein